MKKFIKKEANPKYWELSNCGSGNNGARVLNRVMVCNNCKNNHHCFLHLPIIHLQNSVRIILQKVKMIQILKLNMRVPVTYLVVKGGSLS